MLEDAVDAVATYRLTKLVIDDYITEPLRQKVYKWFGDPSESKVSYVVTCPWCVSMYTGAAVVAARTIAPKAWRPLAYVLAFSAASGWIEEHS